MSLIPAFRCLAVLVAMICATVQARTVYVSTAGNDAGDGLSWGTAKKTVQAGLNAAAAGDQVWVVAGTYVERVTLKVGVGLYGGFAGNETDLAPRNWGTNVTILDGNHGGNVVTTPSGATTSTSIDGFTICNGETDPSSPSPGGGIYCYSSSPTIVNNTITGNSSSGVSCSSSSPAITNTIIAFNSSGVLKDSAGSPTLRCNCVFGNIAYDYSGLVDPTGTDGNISVDPKLAWPYYVNVHIQPDSPCRNAGDDSVVQAGWLDMWMASPASRAHTWTSGLMSPMGPCGPRAPAS